MVADLPSTWASGSGKQHFRLTLEELQIKEGANMFEDKAIVVEEGVIFTEIEIEEMEEIVAPGLCVGN